MLADNTGTIAVIPSKTYPKVVEEIAIKGQIKNASVIGDRIINWGLISFQKRSGIMLLNLAVEGSCLRILLIAYFVASFLPLEIIRVLIGYHLLETGADSVCF